MKHTIEKTVLLCIVSVFSFFSSPLTSRGSDDFSIISARYGVPGNYRDVTLTVRGYVSNNSISMKVSNQNLQSDPAPGREKQMVVVYQKRGIKTELHIREGDWFVVPGPEGAYRPPHHGTGRLEIIRALYGAGGKYRIVTGDVQNHVQDNNINMRVSNENLGGDPAPHQEKELIVIYRKQGREYGAHLHEGSWFIVTD